MADIIRHQYQNDELVHKLRSMLNDLPTLRSRAVKKLKHWREAAIKRLLMKQKELEKTLLDKFERLEFDTQLFVEKIERKKSTTGSRRWNSEPLGYDNTKQIERISINLKSIREELEQSKLLLVDGIDPNSLDIVDKIHTMTMSQQLLTKQIQQQKNNSIINKHSSTTSGTRSYDIYELGSELKRVLDICTSPQSSTSLSADEQSPLQSLDNINNSEHLYDANIRRTTAIHEPFVQRDNQSHQQKRLVNGSHTSTDQRRDSQTLITNDSSLSSQPPPHSPPTQSSSSNSSINNANINNNNNCHKLFQIESFDDSIRRFQRLREIRKNLRTKYDDQQQINQISSNSIIDENIEPQFIEQKRSIPIPSSNERSKTQTINNFSSSAPSTYLINGVKTFTKDRKTIALDHLNEPLDINNNNNNKLMTSPTSQIRHTLLAREPISIPIERVQLMSGTTLNVDPDILELYDKATTTSMTNDSKFSKSKIPTSVKNYHNQAENSSSRKITSSDNNYDRRQRSKIVEKQIGIEETNKHDNYFSTHNHSHNDTSFDNQIYGCNTNDEQQQQHHRSTHTTNRKHRSESTNNTKTTTSNRHTNTNRLQIRRSSDDQDDNQKKIQRRHTDMGGGDGKILSRHLLSSWYAIDKEHWTNMLENGWRPTHDHQGVKQISYHNSDDSRHHNSPHQHRHNNSHRRTQSPDFYEKVSRFEYTNLFEQLEFTYQRTINLGNEFWRFLEISGDNQLCLYHQLSKQLILYKPDESLVSLVWPYDGIVDISYSKSMALWLIATQTQICLCNKTLTKILQSIDIIGDWPKRITTSHSSIFHTHKITPISQPSPTQFLLQRYDYKLNCLAKHILESSTIWDISTDDNTQHLAILCDVALLIFDYNLNLLRQIEVTGFKVSKDHFGGWLIADYNANCIWQIMRNDYLKPKKILNVERPWSVIFDRLNWRLVTLSETQNRAKRLLFFNMINIPNSLLSTTTITTS
ncbi:unnamed protein product [Didymodactylos carnosus]|uniref:Uncharacterized protein n=1 Tax=Didymodactylos carnosus TaxID=1234261 RepID=A0A814C175_9BILA|nr:unnamed protein product [Didymodactylos carnosus]CAF1171622.1 unnamed protein product [Didymodactylos carnosus]CAF3713942.1 unnamed protein product [Didymodactylos carnosus]CAF3982891.1 unnamed protein product [Didymodactylos carnosus]